MAPPEDIYLWQELDQKNRDYRAAAKEHLLLPIGRTASPYSAGLTEDADGLIGRAPTRIDGHSVRIAIVTPELGEALATLPLQDGLRKVRSHRLAKQLADWMVSVPAGRMRPFVPNHICGGLFSGLQVFVSEDGTVKKNEHAMTDDPQLGIVWNRRKN